MLIICLIMLIFTYWRNKAYNHYPSFKIGRGWKGSRLLKLSVGNFWHQIKYGRFGLIGEKRLQMPARYVNKYLDCFLFCIFLWLRAPQTNIVERKSHLSKAKKWKPVLKSFDVWAEQLRLDSENEKFRSAVQILGGAPQHSKLNFVFCLYSGSNLPLTAVGSFFYNDYIKIRFHLHQKFKCSFVVCMLSMGW